MLTLSTESPEGYAFLQKLLQSMNMQIDDIIAYLTTLTFPLQIIFPSFFEYLRTISDQLSYFDSIRPSRTVNTLFILRVLFVVAIKKSNDLQSALITLITTLNTYFNKILLFLQYPESVTSSVLNYILTKIKDFANSSKSSIAMLKPYFSLDSKYSLEPRHLRTPKIIQHNKVTRYSHTTVNKHREF